ISILYSTYTLSYVSFVSVTLTTTTYTLSLHDALPIYNLLCGLLLITGIRNASAQKPHSFAIVDQLQATVTIQQENMEIVMQSPQDRKSTRLNSSHVKISYAVFCLKKKITQEPGRSLNE